jgi:YihY family inner membrane protein
MNPNDQKPPSKLAMSLLSILPHTSAPPPPRVAPLQPEPPSLPKAGDDGWFGQMKVLARYLSQTEVHTYAFSVAANSILSLFPFIVMMFTIARRVFHSRAMEEVIGDEIRYFLPAGQDFVVKNMSIVAHAKSGVQIASVIMLLVSSTGVFLPLEVALNQVWGVRKNRSYIMNQLISLGLAFAIGTLILISVAFTASQHTVLNLLFLGNTQNVVFQFFAHWLLQISAAVSSVLMFFIIYWVLPNCKLPVRAVLPTAVVTGLAWELAKMIYIGVLPLLDFRSVYGPFSISVSLMMWAFLSGLLLLAGAQYSATRYTRRLAFEAAEEDRRREQAASDELPE